MAFYDVPGVYPRVLDESQFSEPQGQTPCAVVGAFAKGPLVPTLVTSVQQLYTLFGNNDPSIGFAGYCATAALGGDDLSAGALNPRGTTQVWVRRVVHSDALFAVTAFNAGAWVVDGSGDADPSARAWNSGDSFIVFPLGAGAAPKWRFQSVPR